MSALWIRGGRLLDPSSKLDSVGDLWIEDGRLIDWGTRLEISKERAAGAEIVDASGLWVTPGWVDIHTHLREPGGSRKETIRSGSEAAAAGGFSTIVCMANTQPTNDSAFVTNYIYSKAKTEAIVNVFAIGAVTKGLKGEELAEIGAMWEAGIVALSDDGKTVMNAYLMRKAMDYSKRFGLTVISHAEDACLKGRGVMNEGPNSTRFGLRGVPKASEEVIVARDIELARLTGAKLHIAHVSTAGSVEMIRRARRRGIEVSGEATPHHLHLTDDAVAQYDTNTKVAPPLREKVDLEALREGIGDGTIEVLATDHAPHSREDKEVEYDLAEFGMIGLETAAPLYYRLVAEKTITEAQMVSAMTHRPAQVVGLKKGTFVRKGEADVTLFDPRLKYRVDRSRFRSKSQNTPFHGWDVEGKVRGTVVRGQFVFRDLPEESK